jgi:hypothetical protein
VLFFRHVYPDTLNVNVMREGRELMMILPTKRRSERDGISKGG